MLFKLVVLLSATLLTLAAPTVKEAPSEITPNVEIDAELKKTSSDFTSTIENKDPKELNPDGNPVIKDILDKLDKSDITKVIDEETALRSKSSLDGAKMTTEGKKSDEITQILTENVAENSENKLENTMIKEYDNTDLIKKITEETDQKLKDVASAVSEVVTSLPIPARPDTSNKYTEVLGHFISDLLQIPMVLLQAVSNAIATLTNNKVNIPTPAFLSSVTKVPHH